MRTKLFGLLVCLAVWCSISRFAVQAQVGIAPSGPGQVTISWPSTNNWLQTTPLLTTAPFSWVNFSGSPTANGGMSSVMVAATNAAGFFRVVNSSFPPPTRLVVSLQNDGTFMLSWDSVAGAASYNVYMASVSGVNPTNYASLPAGAVTTGITTNYLAVSGLTAGTGYYFVVTAVSAAESVASYQASGIYGPHGGVNGQVYTPVSLGGGTTYLAVPGVTLSLVNNSNPAINATVQSDVSGRFKFPPQPSGSYQLCWQAPGFVSDCLAQSIIISNVAVDLNQIAITAATSSSNGMVYGSILFQDGTPAYVQNSSLQISAIPTVALTDGTNGTVGVATVNSQGRYFIVNVPPTNSLQLSASLEGARVTTNIDTTIIGEADLVIPNTPPTISSVVASVAGTPVYRVAPGTTVQVAANATDPDGNPLSFQWFTASGVLPGETSSNISWTLPANDSGFEYLFVRVSDGLGGYADARLALDLTTNFQFSGQVVDDATGLPITNASVQLNGVTAGTDDNGYFSVMVGVAGEYDLSIASPGYMTLARFLTDETTDQRYPLLKISANPCNYNTAATALATNAAGVAVEIAPGSLVDSNGMAYSGDFSVSLDSLDPCCPENSLAGDNLTTNQGVLSPYGFVNITVQDCSGNPLYLGPAATANLFLPIATDCVDANNTPAAAQFFTQAASTNRWFAIGTNSQTAVAGVPGFIGGILAFGPVAAATSTPTGALLISADRTLHVPFTIGIFKTNATELIKYQDVFYQTAQDTTNGPATNISGQVVSDLPAGPVLIKILDLRQSPGEFFKQGVVVTRPNKTIIQIITNTVTANATNTVIAGLGVGDGRAAQLAQLTPAAAQALGFLDVRDVPEGGNTDPGNPNSVFNQYYSLVDPGNKKDTFAHWQVANGWPANNAGIGNFSGSAPGTNDDAFGIYFNATELGAGRRTGMKINGNNVAYYVATYASLADAEVSTNLKYIVCMEYSPHPTIEPTNGYIKFYAYGKDGARTGIVPDEDRHRAKYVPYVCMVCHGGGDYAPAATLAGTASSTNSIRKGDVGAEFIGFDTAGYTFSTRSGFDRASLFAANTFTKFNQGLLKSYPIMPPDNLLSNLIATLTVSNLNYTVSPSAAWETNAAAVNLYNQGYAVSCRSCHTTQGDRYPTFLSFTNAAINTGRDPNDTTWEKIMPQSQRAYAVFWGSATASKINPSVYNAPAGLGGTNTLFK